MLKDSDRRGSYEIRGQRLFATSGKWNERIKKPFSQKCDLDTRMDNEGKEKGLAFGGGKLLKGTGGCFVSASGDRSGVRSGLWSEWNTTGQCGRAPKSPDDMIIRAPHQCRHGVL